MKIVMLGNDSKEEIEKRLQVVASAGYLSRSAGTVTQVFDNHQDYESNLKIARAVVGYGHKSISEHDYLVFALEDVTPIVEQTVIAYRLTSFTIKSRRNVDFREVGFYTPSFKDKDGKVLSNNEDLKKIYQDYMNSLFTEYGKLVDQGIPVEDCRYVLPYSYHSNIIMGCDANELLNMTSNLLYGKESNITELREFGEELAKLIKQYVPYLSKALENESKKKYYEDKMSFIDDLVDKEPIELLTKVNMTNFTENADEVVLCNILMRKYQYSNEKALEVLKQLKQKDPSIARKMMQAIIHSKDQRELEQVMFSFEMPIELAVLTHFTRHRMHSLEVPSFVPIWDLSNYITPPTIVGENKENYDKIYINNIEMMNFFKSQGVRDEDLVYFYLSGNACNIYTTMNARTLEWISRMRCCNKAQYSIRNIANQMKNYASEVAPLIGEGLGPTCIVEGYCPEGKDSCKLRSTQVILSKKKDNK